MCSGFKPKARFHGLLRLKNRHFYAVPGTAGKSSSADKPRGSAEAPENSRIYEVFFTEVRQASAFSELIQMELLELRKEITFLTQLQKPVQVKVL